MNDQLQLDRRRFLQAGGAATLALCLGGGAAATPARAGAPDGLDPLRRGGWEALAADGRPLRAGSATLRLDGVAGADDAFAVALRGAPGAVPLTQGVHALGHPLLAGADLFLAPVGPAAGEEGQAYELVVDRSVPAPRVAPAARPAGGAAAQAEAAGAGEVAGAGEAVGAGEVAADDAPAERPDAAAAAVPAPRVAAAAVAWRRPGLLVADLRLAPDPALELLRLELSQAGRPLARGAACPLADGSLLAALRQPRDAARPTGAATLTLTAIGLDGGRARTAVAVTLR